MCGAETESKPGMSKGDCRALADRIIREIFPRADYDNHIQLVAEAAREIEAYFGVE